LENDLFALSEVLGIKRCHLVGYSMGGALALYAAVRNPERFESLTLIEAPFFTEQSAKVHAQYGDELSGYEQALIKGLEAYTASTRIAITPERRQKLMEQYHNLVEVGGLLDMLRFCGERLEDLPFERLDIPVLLLYGRWSGLCKTGRLLAKRLPRASLYKKWADHNLPVTRSKWVSRRLVEFLDSKISQYGSRVEA
jgi:pimeloyl-ACP methyl ester carboxylesterase